MWIKQSKQSVLSEGAGSALDRSLSLFLDVAVVELLQFIFISSARPCPTFPHSDHTMTLIDKITSSISLL